jgi:hypothetical protein
VHCPTPAPRRPTRIFGIANTPTVFVSRITMKISLGVFAVLLITGSIPAHAQSSPPGSYRTNCIEIRVDDRTLTAVCRIADGREQRTSLTDLDRCSGDIENDNGALTCNHGKPMAPYREDRR